MNNLFQIFILVIKTLYIHAYIFVKNLKWKVIRNSFTFQTYLQKVPT
jgi:hypothetical protein